MAGWSTTHEDGSSKSREALKAARMKKEQLRSSNLCGEWVCVWRYVVYRKTERCRLMFIASVKNKAELPNKLPESREKRAKWMRNRLKRKGDKNTIG